MNIDQQYLDYAMNTIVDLCGIPSPSGFTSRVTAHLLDLFRDMGYKPATSNKGSVLVELGGEGNPLVLAAHVDTLGAMVRSIKSSGRLRFTRVGGYPGNFVEAENCLIHTREGKCYQGTIQTTHASLHAWNDAGTLERKEENMEIVIDEKVSSKEDVGKLGISTGDFVSFDPRTLQTDSGYLKSRHLDDKASAGLLIALAKWLRENGMKLTRKVTLLFTTYEEVGHGGASGIPSDTREMISVDMGVVGDDLETDEHKVSICAKDSQGPYDWDVTNCLIHLAKTHQLNYAVDIYPYYGSDVDASLRAGHDILHGLIGPGVYASHGYERTHREGIDNTMRLLAAYIAGDAGQ